MSQNHQQAAIQIQRIWRGFWRRLVEKRAKAANNDGNFEEIKMTDGYNHWYTLDDNLDICAVLRGIHNIQERGGSSCDEEQFLRNVGFY